MAASAIGVNPRPAAGYHASSTPITTIIITVQPHGRAQNPGRSEGRLSARPEHGTTRRIGRPKWRNWKEFLFSIRHVPPTSKLCSSGFSHTNASAAAAAAEDSFPSRKMETGGGSLAQLRRHIEGDGGAWWP